MSVSRTCTSSSSPSVIGILVTLTLSLHAGATCSAEWEAQLQDGSQIEVDPSTHKAWRVEDGARSPLWDGTHRLDDGSVVIVRDGTAVPSEAMLETWHPPAAAAQLPSASSCYELVDKVCGTDFRCSTAEPCRLANDLVDMAKDELAHKAASAGAPIEDQCREALTSQYFTPCEGSRDDQGHARQ